MRTQHIVRQRKDRASYDRLAVYAVLDAGILCHAGFVQDGMPVVIPMLYARDGDRLLLHGGVASRLMQRLAQGVSACVTVTHLDGLVLAASVFAHSANYRSAVIFGQACRLEGKAAARALDRLVECMIPGRGAEARAANRKEINATTIVELPIEQFSVKRRTGGTGGRGANDPSAVWTGVIPLVLKAGPPEGEADAGPLPEYLQAFGLERRGSGSEAAAIPEPASDS